MGLSFGAISELAISELPATGGGTTQNVTMTTAVLKFAGFPTPINGRQMFTTVLAPLKFAGFPTGLNGKSQFTLPNGILTFICHPVTVTGALLFQIPQAVIQFIGRATNIGSGFVARMLTLLGVGS